MGLSNETLKNERWGAPPWGPFLEYLRGGIDMVLRYKHRHTSLAFLLSATENTEKRSLQPLQEGGEVSEQTLLSSVE